MPIESSSVISTPSESTIASTGERTKTLPGATGDRWWLVAFAFCVGMVIWSLGLFGPAAILPYLHDQRGWSVPVISAAVTVHFLVSALVVALMPELHRVLGLRGTVITGVIAIYIGFIGWVLVPLVGLLFFAAIVSGVGLACGSAATVSAIVSLGFVTDRAKALGIALNGTAVGGMLLLPLLSLSGNHVGLQWTLALLGGLAFVGLLWMSTCLARFTGGRGGPAAARKPVARLTRGDLFRTARFRSLAFAFSIAVFIQIGIYSQLISHLRPILGADGAALAMTGCVALAILGRFAVAWRIGHANRRRVAAANFLMQAIGVVALALATEPMLALAGCILFGLGLGNLPLLPPLIAQEEFAESEFGLVVATVSAINQIVLAFGPIFFGIVYELGGTYSVPFMIGAMLYLVAAGTIMLHANPKLRPSQTPRREDTPRP